MSNNVKDRRSLIKELNSKRIYLFGKDDKKYPCIIGGYDNVGYLLYVKKVNPKHYLSCFPIKELINGLYKNKPFMKKTFTLVNNDFGGYSSCVWLHFSEIDCIPLDGVDTLGFNII